MTARYLVEDRQASYHFTVKANVEAASATATSAEHDTPGAGSPWA
jgi:hypothetical protein